MWRYPWRRCLLRHKHSEKQWTWQEIQRRAAEVLRQEGLRSLWFKLLGETVYRRAVLMERLFAQPVTVLPSRVPVMIGPLEETEVQDYLDLRPDADPADI